ncbi:adhesive plaque matrix protein [Cheilinus undulatus]|uniref:adhesive plaque matrix protein n=1 Tax=Cheilinus undulatus TaxID=241271 RepID=UPI001BD68220|nr:adhesive plaque matrix protein [Cheilinus undulatus]
MVCGVHLGVLLICLVQAEHVRCLWASQAQSSQGQSSNAYVGFSQQDSGLRRLGGSYPQNELRQASVSPGSAQSSSLHTQTSVSTVYSQKPSSSSYSQSLSQPAQSGHSSVRFVQANSVSKPNWQSVTSTKVKNEPKRRFFGLSTEIASGSSVSQYNKRDPTDDSKKATLPVQQSASKYPSSSPSLTSYQSAAQATSYVQGGYSPALKPSSLSSPKVPTSQRHSVRMQTSASAPARRVYIRRTSHPSKISSKKATSWTEATNPHQSHGQGSYKPASTDNMPSSQPLPSSNKQDASASFQPRSTLQSYSSRGPVQGAHNQPAPRYAPTRTYSIPQRFGGYAIRRLGDAKEQREEGTRKLQQTYTAPSAQTGSYKPQLQSIRKPQQTQTMAYQPQVQSVMNPGQTYSSVQTASYRPRPQDQSIVKPGQTYSAPSVQTASNRPQDQSAKKPGQSVWKPQQANMAPSARIVSYKPQQSSSAQTVSYKPKVQRPGQTYTASSVHKVSEEQSVQRVGKPVQVHSASYKPQQSSAAQSGQTVLYKPQVQSVAKPEQAYTAPSAQKVFHEPKAQNAKKQQQAESVPSAQIVSYKPQQSFSAPSAQSVLFKPQVQSMAKPHQTYMASSVNKVSEEPKVQSVVKPQQAHSASSTWSASHKPQQSSPAPSGQSALYKPHVQSTVKRVQTYTAASQAHMSNNLQYQSARKPQQTHAAPASYKPQQTFTTPPTQTVSYKPKVPRVHQKSRWMRIKPQWGQ